MQDPTSTVRRTSPARGRKAALAAALSLLPLGLALFWALHPTDQDRRPAPRPAPAAPEAAEAADQPSPEAAAIRALPVFHAEPLASEQVPARVIPAAAIRRIEPPRVDIPEVPAPAEHAVVREARSPNGADGDRPARPIPGVDGDGEAREDEDDEEP